MSTVPGCPRDDVNDHFKRFVDDRIIAPLADHTTATASGRACLQCGLNEEA